MVAVIMPVYQGESNLGPQIESILNQTYPGFHLYIRDDCSGDNSLKIIQAYAQKDARVSVLKNDQRRRGVTGSIKILLEHVQESVVFFADQDDVWMPHKIETMLSSMPMEADSVLPVAIFSDLKVVDKDLKEICPSFWSMAKICPTRLKFYQVLRRNCVTGCALAINKPMLNIARKMPDDVLHDWWIAIMASLKGRLVPVSEPLVWYRQHEANTIGAQRGGWARMTGLIENPVYREKYLGQLQKSLVHLRNLSADPYIGNSFVNKLLLFKERLRRTLFFIFLRIFSV